MERNPYAPPLDDTPPGAAPTPEDGFIEGGRGVPAARGAGWLTEGWEIVKGNVGSWILVIILYVILAVVVSIIPFVGQLAFPIMAPILSAGLYLGCQGLREGREFGVGHLFEGFNHAGALLGIALVHFAQAVVLGGVGLVTGAGGAFVRRSPFAPQTGNPLDAARLQGLGLFMLATLALSIPVSMATFYAPALVAIRRMSSIDAMKNSFLGAAKNVLPFIVYCLVMFLFSIAAAIPCGLGFLVLGPVVIASVYVSYRDVFFASPSP
jgi:hypothetical protein